MLYCCGVQLSAYLLQHDLALIPVIVQDADFDYFVALKCSINFGENGSGQPRRAYHDDGLERMRTGFEVLTL